MNHLNPHRPGDPRNESGYTLIELLVAMVVGLVVVMAGFALLQFTTEDVSHITDRVHADQVGRTALERVMLELHSACVAESVIPVLENSSNSVLDIVSESGTSSAYTIVHKHEFIYTPESGATEGTLVEKQYASTGGSPEKYTWATTPSATITLLKGIKQTKYAGVETPIFQYYRYYKTGDTMPSGATFGELNEAAMSTPITSAEAENVAKVTMSFTLAPEGKESATFNGDRPVTLEDSVVFRLSPSSEESTDHNLPCSEKI
jgi:prepilin-type N-terminal cleavage/methylation domain-containing protein